MKVLAWVVGIAIVALIGAFYKPDAGDSSQIASSANSPPPSKCDQKALDDRRKEIANAIMAHDAHAAGGSAQALINEESNCAESLTGDARASHYVDASQAALYGAVYGLDMFGLRKERLELAKGFLEQELQYTDMKAATRERAENLLDTVNEKIMLFAGK